jgi:hypothetical protein
LTGSAGRSSGAAIREVLAMDIYPIPIPKALLDAAPENERTLHLTAGQLVNDLNILRNLTLIALNPVSGHEIITHARRATVILMLKLMAGKLNEGWEFIRQQFSPLYTKYEGDLSDSAKQLLDELKKYFGKSNVVNIIRNKAGFHSDVEVMKKGYEFFPETEIFVDFLADHPGQCLYFSSEIIAIVGMTRLIEKDDWKAGIDKIECDITGISGKMINFFLEYMRAFLERYIPDAGKDVHKDKFAIPDGPPIDTITIPFFCTPPKN